MNSLKVCTLYFCVFCIDIGHSTLNTLFELTDCAVKEEKIFHQTASKLDDLTKDLLQISRTQDATEVISIYQLTKQLTSFRLKSFENSFDKKLLANDNWPSKSDLNNTMKAFLEIHRTLRLPLQKLELLLSGGKILVNLQALHSSQVGLHALHEQEFDLAIEWMEWSTEKVVIGYDNTVTSSQLEDYMKLAVQKHNEAVLKLPETALNVFDAEITPKNRKRLKRQDIYLQELVGEEGDAAILANYWALCSGKVLQTAVERSKLFCHYENKGVWQYGPLKIEHLSKGLFRVYDILSQSTMAKIKQSRRTTVDNAQRGKHFTKDWVADEDKDVPELGKMVELLTGFKAAMIKNEAEPLRVFEYVVGRINDTGSAPHKDNYEKWEVLTILFYINDVELGGSTAFINHKVSAAPVKASAVIWFNMERNGNSRNDLWHGACPVIYGHKIVATKWPIYTAQWKTWPCLVNSEE